MEALKLPPLDFLVNNAGFGSNGHFVRLPLGKELELVDLNVRTLVEITGLFLPAMVHRGHGRILQVGSTAGFQPGPFMATYYASKAFVNSFSEALREELIDSGVTCTVLSPGATKTDFAQTAQLEKSRLFRAGAARSEHVALAGYQGMMRGKTVVVPGLVNRALVQLLRITPRAIARKLAGYLNRS